MGGSTTTTTSFTVPPTIGAAVTFSVGDGSAFPSKAVLYVTDLPVGGQNAFVGRVISGSGPSLTVSVEEILQFNTASVITGATVTFPSFDGQVLSAKDFGARGDGTTADDVSINAAIRAAQAFGPTSGATVALPEGLYMVRGPITFRTPSSGLVNIVGAGIDATILRVQALTGFGVADSVISSQTVPRIRVTDLTIDGNNRNINYPATGFQGRLMGIASDWIAERVKFTGGNNFKLHIIPGSNNIQIRDCIFVDNTVGLNGEGGNDHIAGGGSTNVVIEGNYYGVDASGHAQAGNFMDQVNGSRYVIRNNFAETGPISPSPTGQKALGNIILEGVTESIIEGNVTHNTITVNSDGAYGGHTTVTFPRNVLVINNVIDLSFRKDGVPITLKYDDNVTPGVVAVSGRIAGGGNAIRGNYIYNAPFMGILLESEVTNSVATVGTGPEPRKLGQG